MVYFQAKSDLRFIQQFKEDVMVLWGIEASANNKIGGRSRTTLVGEYQAILQAEATKINGYQFIREQISKNLSRAIKIAQKMNIQTNVQSVPPPSVGGVIIPVNLFAAILKDTSYGGVSIQWILDVINQTIGACEEKVKTEFRRLINPFYWIVQIIILIIRIPFMLIEASGFDISKVEDHFLAKVFKLFEIGIIIYILIYFGINKEQLSQFIMKFFLK